jgi:hypothetical protein
MQDAVEGGSFSPTVSRQKDVTEEENCRPCMLKSDAAALASASEQEAQSQKYSSVTLCRTCIHHLLLKNNLGH